MLNANFVLLNTPLINSSSFVPAQLKKSGYKIKTPTSYLVLVLLPYFNKLKEKYTGTGFDGYVISCFTVIIYTLAQCSYKA